MVRKPLAAHVRIHRGGVEQAVQRIPLALIRQQTFQLIINQLERRDNLVDNGRVDLIPCELAIDHSVKIPHVLADEWLGMKTVQEDIDIDMLVFPDLEVRVECQGPLYCEHWTSKESEKVSNWIVEMRQ